MGNPFGSFLIEHVSEDKARWKDSCWFMGTMLVCRDSHQSRMSQMVSSRPFVVQCGLGMNQEEAGGPVSPGAKKAGSDHQCTRHRQGAAYGKKLGRWAQG